MSELSCVQFFCKKRHGKFCCATCPEPCEDRCLNHPDRCKLSREAKREMGPRHTLTKQQVADIRRLLKAGNMSHRGIAIALGVNPITVSWHAAKLRREEEKASGTPEK